MKPFRLSRRAVLRGAGGIAIGLPFLEIMSPPGRARAAASAAPKRYINFFSPNGTIYPAWLPTAGTSPSSFTLSRILAPLAPNQKDIVVLDGMTNVAAKNGPGDDHMRGMGSMLTGIELVPGSTVGGSGTPAGLAGGISVDQAIANQIGKTTKFKSLELGVQTGSAGTVWGYTSYTAASQPLPPNNDPVAVFTRVFSDSQIGPVDNSAMLRLIAERKSVLDAVIANYAQLGPKLGAFDKSKLDAHLANVRDLETRLSAVGVTGAGCMKPAMPAGNFKGNASFPAVGKAQMDLLVMAMACDLTRVGTIQWEMSVGQAQFTWVDPTINRGHHDMSHDGDSNADTMEKLTKINLWYAQQFNYLLTALAAVPEPTANGMGTMLDNTVVVWCNELSKGNAHSHAPQPFVLAGGAGGALQTGRFMQFASSTPHNNLLVSLINMMGGTATTFGNPMYCTGPLSGL
ncbi:MAG TPA: DUF1552 domain-containing protein [Polyangia bacterium]|nr:DUF1552 domain-containing protein [Polyangia bacterium]